MSPNASRLPDLLEPEARVAEAPGRQPAAPRLYQFDRVTRLGRGTAKPVFAVVHSNGAFFPLGRAIGARHRFLALQAADRRSGGRLPGTVAEIAAGYVRQLLGEDPTGPYVLLGWCQAGNVAYEAAQQLRAAGHAVAAVVLVDTWNPAHAAAMHPLRRCLSERSYSLQVVAADLVQVWQGRLSLHTCLRQRNLARRLLGPMAETVAVGPAGEAYRANKAFDEDLGRQLAVATAAYRPAPYAGKVLHIRSATEPVRLGLDRHFGWGGLTQLEHARLDGDHYTIFLEPAVQEMTRQVCAAAGLEHDPSAPFWQGPTLQATRHGAQASPA